jgi:transposase
VVYDYSFKRSQHDNRAINKMIERAEAAAAGTQPLKKDRFVKIADAVKGVDWDLVERARYLAGLKGYVTNIDTNTRDGQQVVVAYRELYQVERSFRMAKSDLAARPMFHRIRDSIEAHLTIVFAALAVSREAQARTCVSIKKIVQTLRPLRTATISLGHQQITEPPRILDHAQAILTKPIQLRSDETSDDIVIDAYNAHSRGSAGRNSRSRRTC